MDFYYIWPMKSKHCLILILCMAVLSLAACHRPTRLEPYGWEALGGDIDSLTLAIETVYLDHNYDSASAIARQMIDLTAGDTTSQQYARALYWLGRTTMITGDIDRGVALMSDALRLTDSTRYPFDALRIKWNLDLDYHDPDIKLHNQLLDRARAFTAMGDYAVAGGEWMSLGNLLSLTGDFDTGLQCLEMADSMFRLAGRSDLVINNRINYSCRLKLMRDTIGALEIMAPMLTDSLIRASDYAVDIVAGNMYVLNGDTTLLNMAYRLVMAQDTTRYDVASAAASYEDFLASDALDRGDLPTARHYYALADSRRDMVFDPELQLYHLQNRARLTAAEGRFEQAWHEANLAADMADSIHRLQTTEDIRRASMLRAIEQQRHNREMDHRRRTSAWLALTLVAVVLGAVAAMIAYRQLQRQRLQQATSQLQTERARRRLLATELLVKEKENLLRSLRDDLDRLVADGALSPATALTLRRGLKISNASRSQGEAFIDTFAELHPGFATALRAEYPSLTEADVRLAGLIAVGLDNKRLASVMGIRPESVKQARWRLRTKMGLNTGDSLELALSRFK